MKKRAQRKRDCFQGKLGRMEAVVEAKGQCWADLV